ncbi:MAG TPA: metallopeptidase TldD-related protein [Terriglobales bacterium]|nr:metallopeptidase TldD-related protein [Terriglobales bacterium]
MKRSARLLAGIALLAVACSAPAQQTAPGAGDDPVLRAMSAELERSRARLQLEKLDRPYYIEYSVTDAEEHSVDAAFGALLQENRQRSRLIRAVVRVGDYKDDSYFGPGQGQVAFATVGDDELALRFQLWLATDAAYKNALAARSAKQAMLKDLVVEHSVDDFSREPSTVSLGPLVPGEKDPEGRRDLARSISALFRSDPKIDSANVHYEYRGVNRYFLNTEGTVGRSGRENYTLYFTASTQAPDGMRLNLSRDWVMARGEELPPARVVQEAARKLVADLAALRQAPVVEDYRGPVLFAADAAKMIFWNLVGPAITGDQPAPGDSARTTGPWATYYKSRVLPDFLSVVDDPTATSFNGRTLVGNYELDDEGVTAVPVTVVEKGMLVNYLVGRRPIRDFPHSNGHGRAAPGGAPVASFANLFVRANPGYSLEELKRKLIELCRQQDKPYGYFVYSAASGNNVVPELMYRVWAADGRMELVRGGTFAELDMRTLRNSIIAAGDDLQADNSNEAIPKAVINPSVLFEELEVRRNTRLQETLPAYPPPGMRTAVAGH